MDRAKIYMDSSCLIDLVKTKVGKHLESERQSEVWWISALLEASRDGELEVFVSSLSAAECTHVEGDVSKATQDWFRSLLTSGQYTKLISDDPFIAADSQDLRWTHGIKLSGADALHVAAAISIKCVEFVTTDDKGPIKYAEKIGALGLRVIHPAQTKVLPEKYKQTEMFGHRKRAAGKRRSSRRRRTGGETGLTG
jgi:predicted nucleic acid-binding protein